MRHTEKMNFLSTVCSSSLLTITPCEVPRKQFKCCLRTNMFFTVFIFKMLLFWKEFTRVVQKVLSFIQILDFSHNFHFCMDFTDSEINTEILISFSSFIRRDSLLPLKKCLAMALLRLGTFWSTLINLNNKISKEMKFVLSGILTM